MRKSTTNLYKISISHIIDHTFVLCIYYHAKSHIHMNVQNTICKSFKYLQTAIPSMHADHLDMSDFSFYISSLLL